jgi:Holliday junction resolvasome RuvABC endonuclease subunit
MITAAFDPSYVNTGFAVMNAVGGLISHGIINPEGTTDAEKFCSLFNDVQKICNRYKVTRAVVEVPPPFSYKRSTGEGGKALNSYPIQKNSQATSVIITALGKLNIPVTEKFAHQWKLVYGKNLGKKDMIRLAKMKFPFLKQRKLSDHEAESICMALIV